MGTMHMYIEKTYIYIIYSKLHNSSGRLLSHITLQFIAGVCSQDRIFRGNKEGTERVPFW